MTQKIGLEVANGYIKVVSDNTELAYPNRLKKLNGSEFNLIGDLGTVYEYEGNKYVLDPNGISSGGRSSQRYLSNEYLLELLIAISHVIRERNVILTIGVPCRDFENTDLKTKITKQLIGRHSMNIVKNNETEEFIINITGVYIVCEPLGTLCDFVFDENLQIVNDRNQFNYVVIDIGFSTTDILATNGLQIDRLTGEDIGCMDMINDYVRLINAKYKNTDYHFTHSDVGLNLPNKIKKYGKEFDFTTELDEIKQTFSVELDAMVRRSGINLAHYDRILYTGGGALALEGYIELRSNAIIYPEAQMANARGFHKFTLIKKAG